MLQCVRQPKDGTVSLPQDGRNLLVTEFPLLGAPGGHLGEASLSLALKFEIWCSYFWVVMLSQVPNILCAWEMKEAAATM